MGLFAFRRLRNMEAASTEAASLPIPEEPTNGNRDSGDTKRRRRKQLTDTGGSTSDH